MLTFLHQLATGFLMGYLAFTNTLADTIIAYLPQTEPAALKDDSTTITSSLSERSDHDSIPDILLKNAAFQNAAVLESQSTGTPVKNVRDALVNIYCVYRTDTEIRQTTGSGFIVSPQGVVLTNAHVAQFFLLEAVEQKGETSCIVRTGEPATDAYFADLLYISPTWVRDNAEQIASTAPKGTGERDYALLYLRSGINENPLPARFPYLGVDTTLVRLSSIGDTVTIGGYPADHKTEELTVRRSVATTTLHELYTFGTNYGDIYLLDGSPIGTSGISGGPVINNYKEAIALIVTRGDDEVQGIGSLNAITLSYVHRTMQEDTGLGFGENISGNLRLRSDIFKATLLPYLAELLSSKL